MISETELVLKARKGNNRAFKKLYDMNADKLYRFLMQFSKDEDVVADCVQSAFIKAFSNIHNFRGKSKFSTWLFSIGINEIKTLLNSFYLRKKYDEEIENLNLRDDDTHELVWQHDMKFLLSELDDEKKAIFVLFEVEGYSHAEIAEILNITEQLSRTKLFRVKKFLREKWYKDEKAKY